MRVFHAFLRTTYLGLLLWNVACSDVDGGASTSSNDVLDGGARTDASADIGEVFSPCGPTPEFQSEDIDVDTTWDCDVVLTDNVFVTEGATLTIVPGVVVYGDVNTALVVARGARLEARGEAQAPIVFTSSQNDGERAPGDWNGLVLLGTAPVMPGEARLAWLPATDPRGAYGGENVDADCGSLAFVRVEFAGIARGDGVLFSGLTLAGCGAQTELSHVQVHRTGFDAVEVRGGAVDARRVLVTAAGDEAFVFRDGSGGDWRELGCVQEGGSAGDCIELADDVSEGRALRIEQATLIGTEILMDHDDDPGTPDATLGTGGIRLARTAPATFCGVLAYDFGLGVALEGGDPVVGAWNTGALSVASSIFVEVEAFDAALAPGGGAAAIDAAARANLFVPSETLDFGPAGQLASAPRAVESRADCPWTTYAGAFGREDWAADWTAFPAN